MIRLFTLLVLSTLGLALQACVATHSPPRELVMRADHSGLAAHYTEEAVALRKKAEDWQALADFYESHQFPHGKLDPKEHAAHCRAIASAYGKAADEAQMLANEHRREISKGTTQ